MLRKHTPADFFKLFAPSFTERYTRNEAWCVVSPNAPTLEMVSGEYGVNQATGRTMGAAFVMMHLVALNEFYGPDKRMSEGMLDDLASVISTEYGSMKVSELMLFVRKFKAGKYGHFYGNIDPLVITTALARFWSETRPALMEQAQREREKQEAAKMREEIKSGISLDEYLAQKGATPDECANLQKLAAKFGTTLASGTSY